MPCLNRPALRKVWYSMGMAPNRLMWCTSYSERFRETCGLQCSCICDVCERPICDEHTNEVADKRLCPACAKRLES